jgi:DnaJ-class molecular chaperone
MNYQTTTAQVECWVCRGLGVVIEACDQGQHGFSYDCTDCNGSGIVITQPNQLPLF